jgi:hypothetical protein
LPRGDRGLGRGLGRAVLAAHELHEDIHVIAGGQRHRVVLPRVGGDRDAAVPVAAARGDGGDLDSPAAAAAREQVGLPLDDLHHAGANGAEPGDAKADGCG